MINENVLEKYCKVGFNCISFVFLFDYIAK